MTTAGQWVVAIACLASGYFVGATTFLEYHRRGFMVRGLRLRFFRWWRHELMAAQVALDGCLFVTLFPEMVMTVFGTDFLGAARGSTAYSLYVICGLCAVAAVSLWRADATARAKAQQRGVEPARRPSRRAG